MAACHLPAIQNNGHLVTLLHVGRACDDLNHFAADIHLTDNQLIRIGMLLNFLNLAHDDFLQIFVQSGIALHLRPRKGHRVHILLIRAGKFRHICFNP